MTIDISALAAMIRRMDVSATLKSFVVVLAFLFVVKNLAVIQQFVRDILQSGLLDAESGSVLLAWSITAAAVAFTPLAFVVWDWMARKQWGHLAAINGALIGACGYAVIAGLLGWLGVITLLEFEPGDRRTHLVAASALAVALALLTGWMTARSPRTRLVFSWTTIAMIVLLAITLLYAAFADELDEGEAFAAGELPVLAGVILAIAGFAWLVLRAVRHRIALSGDRPRELLLGAIHRKSLWPRLAFLAGLPSSLWSAQAMLTAAFWAFLLARPLVYAGMLAVLGNIAFAANRNLSIALGAILIVAGHLLFFFGKRLAARRIWNPDNPADTRPPVLFLRSFADDQLRFSQPWWNVFGRWIDLWSFRRNVDETMIDEIAQYGPVVALGMPGETNIPFGASRYYSSHDDWQRIVTDTAKRAHAIVIGAGDSPGVRWEYDLLARERLLDKTLMLFPATLDNDNSAIAALQAFSEATDIDVACEPAGVERPIALLSTDAGATLLTTRVPTAAAYVAAVRGHFQHIGSADFADQLGL